MTLALTSAAESRAQRGSAAGLVERVTSHTRVTREETGHVLKRDCYGELNSRRRLSRMRRVVVRSADATRVAVERGGHRATAAFLTLTYRPGASWHAKHLSVCLNAYRMWCQRRGVAVRYQWVIELTRAGVPHYHVLLWVPRGLSVPKPDKAGWWTHGLTRIERARRPVGYLVKYTSKGGSEGTGEIPKGARLFGCANAQEERHEVSRARLPAWLEDASEESQLFRRVPFKGFVCKKTGEVFKSPYELHVIRGDDGRYVVVFVNKGIES